ncbi:MAG: ribonuclease P protein component [Deltaproteobacteria bacterium]|nr:ribonuclease P protein component [Deltaproteobacteria bacterium]
MASCNFPKDERIRERREFTEIFDNARKTHSSHLILFRRSNSRQSARVGITASRKVGVAVVRNRIKRLIREYYRQHKADFIPGFDYSLVVKKSFSRLSRGAAADELRSILAKSTRLKSSPSAKINVKKNLH